MGEASGKNGTVSFDGRLIAIVRATSGLGTFLNQGFQGDRHIVASAITAVEFRNATRSTNGFIAFDFPGKNPPRGGVFDAMADENAVVFTADQQEQFVKLRAELISYLSHRPTG